MDKMQALDSFWKSFNISAYDEATVPDEISFTNPDNKTRSPYITYEVSMSEFGGEVASAVSLWYYDSGWKAIEEKAKQIDEKLLNGGTQIPYDEGTLWIKASQPYRSRVVESNDMVRRILINTIIEYH